MAPIKLKLHNGAMRKHILLLAMICTGLSFQGIFAQTTPAQALKNVTLHNSDGSVTNSATIVWRDGVIEAAGKKVTIPFDAFITDGGDSLHVYPGFIDGYAIWGSPEKPKDLKKLKNPGDPPYDRAGVQPERKLSELLTEDKSFKAAISAGFTTAALYPDGNMLPGQVEVFYLAPESENVSLAKNTVALGGSFETAPGGWGTGAYPSTQMGVMAKFRQLMFDAQALQQHMAYYKQNPEMPAPDRSAVLEALFPLVNGEMPLYFEVDSKENIERLFKLQDEFGFDVVIVSGKEAYAKAKELKKRNIPVLAGIDFSEVPKWYAKQKKAKESKKKDSDKKDSDEKAEKSEEEISEEEQAYRDKQLEAWKAEVQNIRKLLDSGIHVGYASAGLKLKDLSKNLKTLMDEGELSEEEFLKIATINTASILGAAKVLGTVEKGKNASFTVFDKPFSEEKAKVLKSISNGTIFELNGE